MKNNLIKKIGITLLTIIIVPSLLFAHSGRTDSRGGHKDNKNKSGLGDYHYHCGGHPAHLHENGVCPYANNASIEPQKVTSQVKKYTEKTTNFIINNTIIKINTINIDNTNLVELKSLCGQLGISMNYDPALKSIECVKGKNKFTLQIDSNNFWLNGSLSTLNVAPIAYNGRTMVPARVVAEAIGKSVTYNSQKDQIIIE